MIHFLSTDGDLGRYQDLAQNQGIYQTNWFPKEFLFARFAYAVFGLVGDFKLRGGKRLATLIPAKDPHGRATWHIQVFSQTETPTHLQWEDHPRMLLPRKRTSDEAELDPRGQILALPGRQFESSLHLPVPEFNPASSYSCVMLGRDARHPRATRYLEFNDLPPEIRRMIWEETWPEPEVIKLSKGWTVDFGKFLEWEGKRVDADTPFGRLEPCGNISTWLQRHKEYIKMLSEFDTPVAIPGPESPGCTLPPDRSLFLRRRRYPIALSINSESRSHAHEYFVWITNYANPVASFYYSPKRDVFWPFDFSADGTLALSAPRNTLWKTYGQQLSLFNSVIMEQALSNDIMDLEVVQLLGGVKTFLILLEDEDTPEESLRTATTIRSHYEGRFGLQCVFKIVDHTYKVHVEFKAGN